MSLCASNQLKKPSEKSSIQFSKRNSDGERDAAGRRKGQNNRDIIGVVSSIGLQKVNGERRSLLNIKKRNSNTSINESNHLLNESDSSTSISSMQKLNSYRSLDVVASITPEEQPVNTQPKATTSRTWPSDDTNGCQPSDLRLAESPDRNVVNLNRTMSSSSSSSFRFTVVERQFGYRERTATDCDKPRLAKEKTILFMLKNHQLDPEEGQFIPLYRDIDSNKQDLINVLCCCWAWSTG
mmetsp:Transcript_10563/g.14712  ORF Transcript_10563/g.14712 Transcript_10563/m.14712 type:complete len:239 (-) Transcript_10563:292-1008(-)